MAISIGLQPAPQVTPDILAAIHDSIAGHQQQATISRIQDEQKSMANRGLLGNILGGLGFDALGRLGRGAEALAGGGQNALSAGERQTYREDPTKYITQRVADIGQLGMYALPAFGPATGLGNILTGAGIGATGGALAGYGGAGYGEDAGSAAMGGAIGGGLTGGALSGLGQILGALKGLKGVGNKVTQAGENIEKSPMKFTANAARSGINNPADAQALTDNLYAIAKEHNINMGGPVKTAQEFGKLSNELQAQKSGILAASKERIPVNALTERVAQLPELQISPEILKEPNNPVSKAIKMLENSGEMIVPQGGRPVEGLGSRQLSLGDVDKVRRYVDQNIRWTPTAGSPVAAADVQSALKSLRNELTDVVTQHSSFIDPATNQIVNPIADINRKISVITNAQKQGVFGRMAQNAEGRLPFGSEVMKTLSSIMPEQRAAATVGTGKGIQKLGNLIGGVGDIKGVQGLQNLLTNPKAQYLFEQATRPGQSVTPGMAPSDTTDQTGVQDTISLGDVLGNLRDNSVAKNQQVFSQLLSQGMHPTDAKLIANQMSPVLKSLSSTDRAVVEGLDDSTTLLNHMKSLIQSNEDKVGPVAGRVSSLKELMGDASSTKLRVSVEAIRQQLAKSLEKGKISDKDATRYAQMLTRMDQSPAQLYATIDALQSMISQQQKGLYNSLGSSGYDNSGVTGD